MQGEQNIFELLNEKYVLPKRVKLFESFAGVGCQRLAFNRLGIEVDMVGISEIDKYALKSYMAIHGDTKNYGDITQIKGINLPQIDVFTYSFPCTDLSKAGKQAGLRETRSGLVYEVLRILQELKLVNRLPKCLIMENVVDLVQVKFIRQFQEIQLELEQLGYSNYAQTMNAKHYGVAQNRDRIFMVSVLGDYYYEFPKPIKLEKRLKDYLENYVDEKYYITDYSSITELNESYSQLNGGKWEKLHDIGRRFYNTETISPTVHTMGGGNLEPKISIKQQTGISLANQGKEYVKDIDVALTLMARDYNGFGNQPMNAVPEHFVVKENNSTGFDIAKEGDYINIPEATIKGYAKAYEGDGVYINRPHQKRGVVQSQMIQTIKTSGEDVGVIDNLRIRKLTPKECWRLMGIDDIDFEKASKVVSNSQLYKQAGNGIVVDVFAAILNMMIE